MFTKVYRYRVQLSRIDEFLQIQKQADWIYRKHVKYRITHLQNRADPSEWVEMHWYPTKEVYDVVESLTEREPELAKLFQQFFEVLDPKDPAIRQELFDDRTIRD